MNRSKRRKREQKRKAKSLTDSQQHAVMCKINAVKERLHPKPQPVIWYQDFVAKNTRSNVCGGNDQLSGACELNENVMQELLRKLQQG